MSKNNQKTNAPPKQVVQASAPKGIRGWFYRNWSYIAAFILPVVLIYIAYALFGLYPFKHGDTETQFSVLCLDLNGQYVYYFEAIRDAFHGDGSILYNWSRNLSGGYMGVIGYYLASPFTLIVILLPRTMILGALQTMIITKLGAASVTFSYYARKSKHVSPLMSVMLGCMFGMCAYGIIQTIDPMWLDGLVCLPMIALGIEYLIDDGRKNNYIIPLALICVANFYIGFMCCIFTALYFFFYLFAGSDKFKVTKNNIIRVGLRMFLATVIALCLAAFMVIPVYKALQLGKMDFAKPASYNFGWKTGQFSVSEFIAQFCVNQYNSVNVEGKPEVYCGVLAFICCPLYFFNRRIPFKQKVGYGALLFALFFSMFFKNIDIWWHGGQMPNWLPFRYSFTFSFVLLSMAAVTLRYSASIQKYAYPVSFGVLTLILIYAYNQHYLNMKGAEYLDKVGSIGITVLLLGVYAGLIYALSIKNLSKGARTAITLAMLGICSVELCYNAKCEFEDINTEVAYSTRKSYREYIASGRDVVDQLYEYDSSFYRAEKTYVRCVNDNSAFRLRGITHSSSVMNAKILKFIEAMGYSSSTYYSRYDGNTPVADSILGIKYVLDKDDPNENILKKGVNSEAEGAYEKVMSTTAKSQSETDIDVNIYENPNALALGYMVSTDAKKIGSFGNDNPFNSQNILLSTITGNTKFTVGGGFESWTEYYHPIQIYQTDEMVQKDVTNPRLNDVKTEPYGTQTNYREIVPEGATHAADPTVDFFIETTTDEPLYLFFQTENQSKVNLWLADQWNLDENACRNQDGSNATSLGSYFEGDDYKILYVGTFEPGTQLQLRMTLTTDSAGTKEKYAIINNYYFYHLNTAKFAEDISTLKDQQWELTTYGGRKLEGTVTAKENQMLMTTIPAEPGWEIWVDGVKYTTDITTYDEKGEASTEKANFVTLFQSFIAVDLEPGEHTIKMKYTPPGLRGGLLLLVIGIAACIAFYIYDSEHNEILLKLAEAREKGIYELPYEEYPDPDVVAKQKAQEARSQQMQTEKAEMKKEIQQEMQQEMQSKLISDELIKLKELRDEGILTQEEFDAQKKKLLDQ